MSRSFNSLRVSDVITTPIKLKYTSSYESDVLTGAGIGVLSGVNGAVTITGSVPQQTLNYRSIRQLYYANFLTGSYLSTTSSFDCSMQSTAASGTLDADLRYFPTESGAEIRILSIPRQIFGQKISRLGFLMSSSALILADDGNGNIVDGTNEPYVQSNYYDPQYANWYVYDSLTHVGNIIYSQGIVVITNPDYLAYFPTPPVAVNDEFEFPAGLSYAVDVTQNDLDGTGALDPPSVVIFGGDVASFTNNLNGNITLNATTPGVYKTYYTVNSIVNGYSITSNVASVTITLV